MKKITLMVMLLVSTMLGLTMLSVEASEVTNVSSEKIWTVTLNAYVLNTEENLQHVQLLNSNGETVPSVVTVNRNNAKVIEVYPVNNFTLGEYTIVVDKALQSSQGLTLTEKVEKQFIVDKAFNVTSINGQWSTFYEYDKTPYEINVNFNNGQAFIYAVDIKSEFGFEATKPYSLENGFMKMEIDELKLSLSGDILSYSDKEFKLITKSGKFSYFHKK